MKENNSKPKFIKNADVRAGKIPGWPSKPETNGDPFDPNNTARTDAAMVVSEGMVLRNVASLNAASSLGLRRAILFAALVPFAGMGAWYALKLTGLTDTVFVSEMMSSVPIVAHLQEQSRTNKENKNSTPTLKDLEESQAPGFEALSAIQGFYSESKNGIARKYDTSFLSRDYGFPGKPTYDVSFSPILHDSYSKKAKQGYYDNLEVSTSCGNLPLADCLKRLGGDEKFGLLYKAGEDMSLYREGITAGHSDMKNPSEVIEGALAKFREEFPKEAPTYCDSDNRKYADMPNNLDLDNSIKSIKAAWEKDGTLEFNSTVKKVGNINELIAHRVKKDKDCENIQIAALKVNDGAIRYMLSVAGRTHNEDGTDNIGQALYLLVRLNQKEEKSHKMLIVGCNNCDNIPALDGADAKRNLEGIVPYLKESAEAIIDVFEDGDLVVQKPTKNNKEG